MPNGWPPSRPKASRPAVLHHDEVFADPQILARGMVGEVQHAKAGKQKTLGVPLKLSANLALCGAPTLGQHDGELKKTKAKGEKPWPERRDSSQRSR